MIDRSAVARALAKALAFKTCGKQDAAESWAIELIHLLECDGILSGPTARWRQEGARLVIDGVGPAESAWSERGA